MGHCAFQSMSSHGKEMKESKVYVVGLEKHGDVKTPYKFKYPQNCYRCFFLLSFLWVLGFSTYWKVYIKKIYLLELRQEDLPLKLRQEDLLSKASSRRFAF